MTHFIVEMLVIAFVVKIISAPFRRKWPLANSIGKTLRRIFYPGCFSITSLILVGLAFPFWYFVDVAGELLFWLSIVSCASTVWFCVACHYTEKEIRRRLGIPMDAKIEPEQDLIDAVFALLTPQKSPVLEEIGM